MDPDTLYLETVPLNWYPSLDTRFTFIQGDMLLRD